ncbi:MAG: HEPN domain-containing protein [Caldilineaceae bacterium]|nr:HEPN domain-containing protein [Caldilineaceae bacterium]MDE0068716.1 HEPN domain-containing protein [Caldilineaceae bacterium]MDE0182936.1 HEPN domain-containing protein [Caldilineaceae bacterium]
MSVRPPEQDWIDKADDDLEVARRALGPPSPLPWVACFHAQQCAEKFLKGFLVSQDLEFLRVHDLVYLVQRCNEVESSFDQLMTTARILMRYSAAIRYPVDSFDEPDEGEAAMAIELATQVAEFVRQQLQP